MLVESVLLFFLGGSLGVLLARWSADSLLAFAVTGGYVPERMTVAVDGRVLAVTLLVSLVAGVVFGLVPALHASKVDLSDGLKASSTTGGFRRRRASRLLIVSELAISLVLLVGSGLMIRSFLHLQTSPAGIDPENLLQTISDGGRSFPEAVAYWRSALDRTRQDPGVLFAAVTSRPPFHGARGQKFAIDGRSVRRRARSRRPETSWSARITSARWESRWSRGARFPRGTPGLRRRSSSSARAWRGGTSPTRIRSGSV